MRYLGIDPGKSGGWALLQETDRGRPVLAAGPLPLTYDRDYDIKAIVKLMRCKTENEGCLIVYEKLHAMPAKMGGSIASFERGYAQGMLKSIAVTLGLPETGVSPQRWQKEMLPPDYRETYADTKDAALAVASAKFPYIDLSTGALKAESAPCQKKPHGGIVDAILIAEYARLNL